MTYQEFLDTIAADYWETVDNGTADEPLAFNVTVICHGEGCDDTPRANIVNVTRNGVYVAYCICGTTVTDITPWGYEGVKFDD